MNFPFRINWQQDPLERLEWLTDVFVARDGRESAIKLRENPRRTLRVEAVLADDNERVRFEQTVLAGLHQAYQLPYWPDAAVLTQPVTTGAVLTVDNTAHKNIAADAPVALVSLDGHMLVAQAVAVTATTIELDTLPGAWPVGTVVAPVFDVLLQNPQQVFYRTDAMATAEVSCVVLGDHVMQPTTELDDYRGYSVHWGRPDWSEGVQGAFKRDVSEFDPELGRISRLDVSGWTRAERPFRVVLQGREDIADFRAWLAARAGRYQPFYLPSQQRDFTLAAGVDGTDTVLEVSDRLHRLTSSSPGRRDIAIRLVDGTTFYRRIVAVTTDAGSEWVEIDTPLGQSIAPGEVSLMCYMPMVRLASDAVEFLWRADDVAVVALTFITKRDDDNA